MNKIKRMAFKLFFGLECIMFAYQYIWGVHGMIDISSLEAETEQLQRETTQADAEIAVLQHMRRRWEKSSFLKEKCARQELHMARADEEIFYI